METLRQFQTLFRSIDSVFFHVCLDNKNVSHKFEPYTSLLKKALYLGIPVRECLNILSNELAQNYLFEKKVRGMQIYMGLKICFWLFICFGVRVLFMGGLSILDKTDGLLCLLGVLWSCMSYKTMCEYMPSSWMLERSKISFALSPKEVNLSEHFYAVFEAAVFGRNYNMIVDPQEDRDSQGLPARNNNRHRCFMLMEGLRQSQETKLKRYEEVYPIFEFFISSIVGILLLVSPITNML